MRRLLGVACILVLAAAAGATTVNEDFDDVGGTTSNGQLAGANLEAAGWYFVNDSTPLGSTDWFQGNVGVFGPQATTGYIAANFNNTGAVGTISNWMMLPAGTLQNGDVLSFYTRTPAQSIWPDRLQVWMSLNGASTSVSDFTTIFLDINFLVAIGGYPEDWTQFTVTLSGIGSPTSGRLALRYFVENGGAFGENSNYIGVDTLRLTTQDGAVPEPLTLLGAALGVCGAGAYLRRRGKPAAA